MVEIGHGLEAQFPDEAHQDGFIVFHFPVLEFPFQGFLGEFGLAGCNFFQCLTYFVAGLRRGDEGQPVAFRRLSVRGHDFHLVTAVQFLAELHILSVHAGTCTPASQVGVDGKGKVEYGGSLWQFVQIAFGSEHKHFVLVQVQFELVHGIQVVVGVFQRFPDGVQPFVQTAFTLDAFVSPVSGQAFFGNLIHTFRTDLYFHPFTFRSHDSDVQRLVSVALRYGQPVAQTFGVGQVHVGYDGVGLPALLLLFVERRIEDDADGKQVVHAFEGASLLFHLLVDGVDGLGTSFHVELQSGLFQFFLYRFDECVNVAVARLFGGIQFILDIIVHVVLRVFQRQILQFRFQLVQSQFVCQRGIQVGRFVGHFQSGFFVRAVLNLPHQVHTVGYDNQDDPHVFGKRQKQVAEIFRFDDGTLGIQFVDFYKSPDNAGHVFSVFLLDGLQAAQVVFHRLMKHDAQNRGAAHTDFFGYDNSRLHVFDDGVHLEDIPRNGSFRHGFYEVVLQLVAVIFL